MIGTVTCRIEVLKGTMHAIILKAMFISDAVSFLHA